MSLHDAFVTLLGQKSVVLYFHSSMSPMMTNMALSLQWCVPRIRAGGEWGEASGMERKGWGQGIWKWERKVGNGSLEWLFKNVTE